jgi:asparagine synthase (glutamine-hydrolysing)
MCGICGVVQIGGEPRQVVDPHVLDHMTDVMTHRGPDDRGVLHDPGIALGARRLSIVDVAGGHQPIANEDGTVWAIQNGELYNHPIVRRELESAGHRLRTGCDTEVIPHLYEQIGPSFPRRLRGKFALALWDSVSRQAVIARDRLGVKPLYWALAGDVVVWTSRRLTAFSHSALCPPHGRSLPASIRFSRAN